jgi:hypothetical protein
MRFFQSMNIFAAVRDLRGFMAARERHEIIAAVAAVAITAFIIFAFWKDSYAERQPRIIYVNNWPANRSDAEIEKEIKADSVARHKAMAERQAAYKRLADQLGIK